MANDLRFKGSGSLRSVSSTTIDTPNKSAGLVDQYNRELGLLTLRGLEAGEGITIEVVDSDDNVYSTNDKKIRITSQGSSLSSLLGLGGPGPNPYVGGNYYLKLDPMGTGVSFEQVNPTSTYVVPNLPARDAIIPSTGDYSLVNDTGYGEWGYYIWNGSTWLLLTTQEFNLEEGNRVSDKSFSLVVNYNATSAILVGYVNPGSKISSVVVEVLESWDDVSSTLTVGDNGDGGDGGDPERIMAADGNDLLIEGGVFEINPSYEYIGPAVDIPIYVYIQSFSSTKGSARVTLTYI